MENRDSCKFSISLLKKNGSNRNRQERDILLYICIKKINGKIAKQKKMYNIIDVKHFQTIIPFPFNNNFVFHLLSVAGIILQNAMTIN